MKEIETPKTEVGCIVGRFQTNNLHVAHMELIQTVLSKHERVVVFLGVSPNRNTKNNPIDFKHRKAMFDEAFGNKVEVYPLHDNRSNADWSINLDKQIIELLPPGQKATLYGSRDSFISSYSGKFKTVELESTSFVSASQIRKSIITNYPSSSAFRAGLIAATGMHYPTAYQTVDVAIIDENKRNILLVKKPKENKWRFVGGFSDPTSDSLEEDARRETMEETGVEVSDIKYIGSTKIKDWRFRSEKDCIKTAFFKATYVFGQPEGADDVEYAQWFPYNNGLDKKDFVEEHHVLVDMFNSSFSHVFDKKA